MGPQAPDPNAYYGYLFKPDKTPSDVFDALLRAIATYIVRASHYPKTAGEWEGGLPG